MSCLAASLSPQVPLVLAGTKGGTVFAFHLQEQHHASSQRQRYLDNDLDSHGHGANGGGDGFAAAAAAGGAPAGEGGVPTRTQIPRSDGTADQTELGAVLMKFEHTRGSIEGVCSSEEQVRHATRYTVHGTRYNCSTG